MALTAPAAMAQLEGSALDYIIQKPSFTKHYEDKGFGKHLYMDIGGGVKTTGRRDFKTGGSAQMRLGDWVTPEHGWRVGMEAGQLRTGKDGKPKFVAFDVDYLLNITALSQPTYNRPKRFEVYGIAGAGADISRANGLNKTGWNLHFGLRGQLATSPYTYLYLEPQGAIVSNDVVRQDDWRKFHPTFGFSIGAGYRLGAERKHIVRNESEAPRHRRADGLFVTVAGGMASYGASGHNHLRDHASGRLTLGLGKRFNPYNAVRLSIAGTVIKQDNKSNDGLVSAHADYLLNLHSLFAGPDASRCWSINAVAGASLADCSAINLRQLMPGAGAGLQGVWRLNSRGLDLTLEPRVDMYRAKHITGEGGVAFVPSVTAGLAYTYHAAHLTDRTMTCERSRSEWHNYFFVDAGAGLNTPIVRNAFDKPGNFISPTASVGIGYWMSPLHGVRLWGAAGQTNYTKDELYYRHLDLGLDYLFNFTNAIAGYDPDHTFELTGGLGVNASRRQKRKMPFFGMNMNLRGKMNVSRSVGIYIEPMLQGYGRRYLPTHLGKSRIDWIASLSAGLQMDLRHLGDAKSYAKFDDDETKSNAVYVAGGIMTQADRMGNSESRGSVIKVGFTHWQTPLFAWRISAQGTKNKYHHRRHAAGTVGGDLMTDLTARVYGYDPQRTFSFSALAGLNIGADYSSGKTYFTSDLHAGVQAAIRLSERTDLLLEPQVAYRMSERFDMSSRQERFAPMMTIGLDYRFKSASLRGIDTPQRRQYVSAAFGAGIYSPTAKDRLTRLWRHTFISSLSYGRWFNGHSGMEGSVSLTHILHHETDSKNLPQLRASYMFNFVAAATGASTDNRKFQLVGLAGPTLTLDNQPDCGNIVVPGAQLAFQAGFRPTPAFEIFLQPTSDFYAKRISRTHTPRPFELQGSLLLGTKIHF